jgi:putative transposase
MQLELRLRTWGGRRDGAGRKPAPGRRMVPHRSRVPHDRHCPAHVTLRATVGVPSLRTGHLLNATQSALVAASTSTFRVLHYSVQADHLHLVVEANGPTGFERGVRGLAIRVAKAVNRALGRAGRVWDRYHSRMLRTPREVRNALVYVLDNFRKHIRGARGLDPCSSALWFGLAHRTRTSRRRVTPPTGMHLARPCRVAAPRADRRRRVSACDGCASRATRATDELASM